MKSQAAGVCEGLERDYAGVCPQVDVLQKQASRLYLLLLRFSTAMQKDIVKGDDPAPAGDNKANAAAGSAAMAEALKTGTARAVLEGLQLDHFDSFIIDAICIYCGGRSSNGIEADGKKMVHPQKADEENESMAGPLEFAGVNMSVGVNMSEVAMDDADSNVGAEEEAAAVLSLDEIVGSMNHGDQHSLEDMLSMQTEERSELLKQISRYLLDHRGLLHTLRAFLLHHTFITGLITMSHAGRRSALMVYHHFTLMVADHIRRYMRIHANNAKSLKGKGKEEAGKRILMARSQSPLRQLQQMSSSFFDVHVIKVINPDGSSAGAPARPTMKCSDDMLDEEEERCATPPIGTKVLPMSASVARQQSIDDECPSPAPTDASGDCPSPCPFARKMVSPLRSKSKSPSNRVFYSGKSQKGFDCTADYPASRSVTASSAAVTGGGVARRSPRGSSKTAFRSSAGASMTASPPVHTRMLHRLLHSKSQEKMCMSAISSAVNAANQASAEAVSLVGSTTANVAATIAAKKLEASPTMRRCVSFEAKADAANTLAFLADLGSSTSGSISSDKRKSTDAGGPAKRMKSHNGKVVPMVQSNPGAIAAFAAAAIALLAAHHAKIAVIPCTSAESGSDSELESDLSDNEAEQLPLPPSALSLAHFEKHCTSGSWRWLQDECDEKGLNELLSLIGVPWLLRKFVLQNSRHMDINTPLAPVKRAFPATAPAELAGAATSYSDVWMRTAHVDRKTAGAASALSAQQSQLSSSTWLPLDGVLRPVSAAPSAISPSTSPSGGSISSKVSAAARSPLDASVLQKLTNAQSSTMSVQDEVVICGLTSRTFDVVGVTPEIEWADTKEDPLLQRIRVQYTLKPKFSKGDEESPRTPQKQYVFERCVETQYDLEQGGTTAMPTFDLVAPDWIRVVYSLYRVADESKPRGRSPQGLACVKRVVYIMQR
jgi:hypothetical protein